VFSTVVSYSVVYFIIIILLLFLCITVRFSLFTSYISLSFLGYSLAISKEYLARDVLHDCMPQE
jgi:hypothetical protein